MVRIIQGQLPPGCELFFLMGFDSLTELPTWHEPARLIAACHLVALTRPAIKVDWGKLEAALPGIRQRITILDMPELEISSHQIQERIRRGRTIRYLVPDEVAKYIREQGLYETIADGQGAK
jgi:nicotinate-nucleotide adenylyltransferase